MASVRSSVPVAGFVPVAGSGLLSVSPAMVGLIRNSRGQRTKGYGTARRVLHIPGAGFGGLESVFVHSIRRKPPVLRFVAL